MSRLQLKRPDLNNIDIPIMCNYYNCSIKALPKHDYCYNFKSDDSNYCIYHKCGTNKCNNSYIYNVTPGTEKTYKSILDLLFFGLKVTEV